MKKYTLLIDTAKTDATSVVLETPEGERYQKTVTSVVMRSQSVLPTIELLMKEHSLEWKDIAEIVIATGPGSFTGLRVGATVGATISWLLSIPINHLASGTIPTLEYGQDKWKLA